MVADLDINQRVERRAALLQIQEPYWRHISRLAVLLRDLRPLLLAHSQEKRFRFYVALGDGKHGIVGLGDFVFTLSST